MPGEPMVQAYLALQVLRLARAAGSPCRQVQIERDRSLEPDGWLLHNGGAWLCNKIAPLIDLIMRYHMTKHDSFFWLVD